MDLHPVRSSNLQEALLLVQSLRGNLLDRHVTRGFSGPGRAASGVIALVMACGLAVFAPEGTQYQTRIHLAGWSIVLVLATLINGFSLVHFFLNDPRVKRDVTRMRPVLHAVPPLVVGAGLTLAFIVHRNPDPLFGLWMCMFGLVNFAAKDTLPSLISLAGTFYILAGFACLIAPGFEFTNPWPMGIVFFAGEVATGLILIVDRRRLLSAQAMINASPNGDTT